MAKKRSPKKKAPRKPKPLTEKAEPEKVRIGPVDPPPPPESGEGTPAGPDTQQP